MQAVLTVCVKLFTAFASDNLSSLFQDNLLNVERTKDLPINLWKNIKNLKGLKECLGILYSSENCCLLKLKEKMETYSCLHLAVRFYKRTLYGRWKFYYFLLLWLVPTIYSSKFLSASLLCLVIYQHQCFSCINFKWTPLVEKPLLLKNPL